MTDKWLFTSRHGKHGIKESHHDSLAAAIRKAAGDLEWSDEGDFGWPHVSEARVVSPDGMLVIEHDTLSSIMWDSLTFRSPEWEQFFEDVASDFLAGKGYARELD